MAEEVTFGLSQLKRLRDWRNITQEGLAEAANISLSTIQKQERGVQKDTALSIAFPLAQALGVSIEALFDASITNKLLKSQKGAIYES